ncbi:MAG: hypothetical protein IKQ35_03085 [Bacilli bacterium]|nr:hypothetical protein [Bacilli bacterium]
MKKLFSLLFVALLIVPITAFAADKEPVDVYIFHGSTCPHCKELLEWFETQEEKYGDKYDLVKYEVWNDEKNAELFNLTAEKLGMDLENLGVPLMIIGEQQFSGFAPEEDPELIIKAIEEEYDKDESERSHIVDDVIKENNWQHDQKEKKSTNLIIGIATIVVVVGLIVVVMKAREE